jgi:hypothetical protein
MEVKRQEYRGGTDMVKLSDLRRMTIALLALLRFADRRRGGLRHRQGLAV